MSGRTGGMTLVSEVRNGATTSLMSFIADGFTALGVAIGRQALSVRFWVWLEQVKL